MDTKELTIEEKIANIKETDDPLKIANAWFPPYHEKEYYFISYSHRDYKLVYESLHRLQSEEKHINVWYDHNLTPGRDWEEEARRYIFDFNCKGVIFYLSENAVLSRSIHKEIEFVKKSGKSFLSINLPCEMIKGYEGKCLSAESMLKLLKEQGISVENYDEKLTALHDTFNEKVTFLPFSEDIDSQIDKILSLKREPLFNVGKIFAELRSINDINIMELKKEDFVYFEEKIQSAMKIKSIGNCAFANCKHLYRVDMPENIFLIGNFAFSGCTSLEKVTIPNSVMHIRDGAFAGCTSLEVISIPEKIKFFGKGIFNNCKKLKIVNIPNTIKTIGADSFLNCESLKRISIPDSIETIDTGAFSHCTSLERINIPSNIKYIGINAFIFCKNLKTVTLHYGIEIIEDGAFRSCENLRNINIPSSVISIGNNAFCGCFSLKNIVIPSSVKNIGEDAFLTCKNLKEIVIPDSIISIGKRAFSMCNNLSNIFYGGTKDQWMELSRKMNFAFYPKKNLNICCMDGDIPYSPTK